MGVAKQKDEDGTGQEPADMGEPRGAAAGQVRVRGKGEDLKPNPEQQQQPGRAD